MTSEGSLIPKLPMIGGTQPRHGTLFRSVLENKPMGLATQRKNDRSQDIFPQINFQLAGARNTNSLSNILGTAQRAMMEVQNSVSNATRQFLLENHLSNDSAEKDKRSINNQISFLSTTKQVKRLRFDPESPRFKEACQRLEVDVKDLQRKKLSDFEA